MRPFRLAATASLGFAGLVFSFLSLAGASKNPKLAIGGNKHLLPSGPAT